MKDLRECCEELYDKLNKVQVATRRHDIAAIEGFARKIRNEAMEEAAEEIQPYCYMGSKNNLWLPGTIRKRICDLKMNSPLTMDGPETNCVCSETSSRNCPVHQIR